MSKRTKQQQRQMARERRAAAFHLGRLQEARTNRERAKVHYDRCRSAVANLPPDRRESGWSALADILGRLHTDLADQVDQRTVQRTADIWDRLAATSPTSRDRAWTEWRRLQAVMARVQPGQQEQQWGHIAGHLDRAVVTVRDIRAGSNSEAENPAAGAPTRRRARARDARTREEQGNTTGRNSAPNITHSNERRGR